MREILSSPSHSLFLSLSLFLFEASPRPDSFRTNPLWHPRDIREAAKGIIKDDEEGRDPPLSGAPYSVFNPATRVKLPLPRHEIRL